MSSPRRAATRCRRRGSGRRGADAALAAALNPRGRLRAVPAAARVRLAGRQAGERPGRARRRLGRLLHRQRLQRGAQRLVHGPRLAAAAGHDGPVLACIDARIAFVGGINIIDDLNPPGLPGPRLDYAVQVQGPLLAALHRSMVQLWLMLRWVNLGKRHRPQLRAHRQSAAAGNMEAALLLRDNLKHRREIERAYLRAIIAAREEVIIANAYFLPGRPLRKALRDAAQRGVRVILLLEGRAEYRLQYFATQALYGNLLGAGIRIFEYRKSYLHAKVAVVDGKWATVGSSNIDPFSLMLAREANVAVRDQGFARELRASLEQAMQEGSLEIVKAAHLSRSRRLLAWLSYGLLRFVAGVAGYGKAL